MASRQQNFEASSEEDDFQAKKERRLLYYKVYIVGVYGEINPIACSDGFLSVSMPFKNHLSRKLIFDSASKECVGFRSQEI